MREIIIHETALNKWCVWKDYGGKNTANRRGRQDREEEELVDCGAHD